MRIFAAILALIMAAIPVNVFAAMSSTNYYIYADSVETGGGLSTGGVYSLEGSLGESPSDFSTSSAYEIRAGYQYMERGYLSIIVATPSLNLGTLSTSSVSSASTDVTVSTDSATGYNMSISAVSGSVITAVGDGAVSAGSEEYGFSASGSDSQIVGDVAVAASTLVAATSTPTGGGVTNMTFKASINGSTASGNYSQTVTVSASANI
jgi:hypothetical protein